MKRRKFLENVIFGSTVLSFPLALAGCNRSSKKIKFGICADVHKDIMHDADSRLSEFIESSRENNPDF
ncbi:MAG: hypothetical protein ACOCVA_02840, partial [Prolixibacteraceae bacterium]